MPLRFSPARGAAVVLTSSSRGPAGAAATITVGTVTELAPGATPTVANAGSSSAASFNFGLPGTPTIAVGAVTTLAAGAPATVVNAGDAAAIVLDFGIPQGVAGTMGGTLGSNDNAVPRADGVGGTTLQASGVIIDDSNNVSGVVGLSATTIELGHASDTTLSRVSAGVVAVEGSSILLASGLGSVTQAFDADLATLAALGNWKVVYSNGSSAITALALGADATVFAGNGVSSAPTFRSLDNLGGIVKAGGQTLTGGFKATPFAAGTKSSGTYTPLYSDGNFQTATNGGAHTLAPPADDCTIIIQYTNNGSAGAITTSGFTKVTGAFTTTNGDDFFAYITKIGSFSSLDIKALQ